MRRKKTSLVTTMLPLAIVMCMSLAIVGGIVTWTAAREGADLGELVTELLEGQQSVRPARAQVTPLPTLTPPPSPTPPVVVVAANAEPAAAEATPLPQPTHPPAINTPSPVITSAPSPAEVPGPETQIEQAIESPIRPGSPLPERPATRLVIPAMELDIPVILSPIVNQTWKVDHLGKDFVGHLEGTASPGDSSNVVLAGHVTLAHNVYGPFAGLGQLEPGDSIILYVGDQPYTYSVDHRQLVNRADVQVTYPTDAGRVTLITCSNWSNELGAYQERLIVVGHLTNQGS